MGECAWATEGMSHERHPWKANDHADRNDGADGWDSPAVTFVQRALHPYRVVERGFLEANPPWPNEHDTDSPTCPIYAPDPFMSCRFALLGGLKLLSGPLYDSASARCLNVPGGSFAMLRDAAFLLEGSRVVRQADPHEVAGKRLRQVFPIW